MNIYKNPVLPGFYPDPSMCRVGDTFYMVNSTFAYFPGIPVFSGKNPAEWKQIGNVLDRKSQIPLEGCEHSQGIYAPTIRFHEGRYYIITTNISGGGNFIVTSERPEGPWSDPHFLGEEAQGIDPSLFFEEDGTCWFIGQRSNSSGSRYFGDCEIWMRKLNTVTFRLEGEEYVVLHGFQKNAVWPEGPHLYKKDGYYYILHAEGGTERGHCVMAARSRCVTGPYEYCPFNPILTHRHLGKKSPVTCVGHGDLVDDGHGNWYLTVLGCRPQDGYTLRGRETFLAKVEWEDDWPVVNPGIGMLEEMVAVENAQEHPEIQNDKKPPQHFYDGFHIDKLPPEFLMLRNPADDMLTFPPQRDCLRLKMGRATLKEKASPSYVGIRQQFQNFCLDTRFRLHCQSRNDCAGLAVLQDNRNHIRFETYNTDRQFLAKVILCINGTDQILGTASSADQEVNAIEMRIEICGLEASFFLRFIREKGSDTEPWIKIAGNADIRNLSTEKAGGFTGCTVGMYASANGAASTGYADFEKLLLICPESKR